MRTRLSTTLAVIGVLAVMVPGVGVAKDARKSDCKKGGWRDLVRADGSPFADQGECVGYVANGGTTRPPETRFAIAYSNLNGIDGFQDGSADVLISKLIDGNDDATLNAGDLVVMGRYPTTFFPTSSSDFADWGVASHVVTDIYYNVPTNIGVYAGNAHFSWSSGGGQWFEQFGDPNDVSAFSDVPSGAVIVVKTISPSAPTVAVSLMQIDSTIPDEFVDVDIP